MMVSFKTLTIVEAKRVKVYYFITYTCTASNSVKKRQNGVNVVQVPDGKNETIITGLDPNTEYDVGVYAADRDGENRGPISNCETAISTGITKKSNLHSYIDYVYHMIIQDLLTLTSLYL